MFNVNPPDSTNLGLTSAGAVNREKASLLDYKVFPVGIAGHKKISGRYKNPGRVTFQIVQNDNSILLF
jgi:hypothetical protein